MISNKRMSSNLNTDQKRDLSQIILLLIFSIVFVYFSPYIINQLYFLVLLPFIWKSKKDYFWIGFIFILITSPGNFFSSNFTTQTIAIYNITGGISISFLDLVTILLFIKSLNKVNIRTSLLFPELLIAILIYFIIRLFESNLHTENNFYLIPYLRIMLTLTCFYSISKLMTTIDNYINFVIVLFPGIVLVLASQIYQLFTSTYLIGLFSDVIFADKTTLMDRLAEFTPEILLLYLFLSTALIFIFNKSSFLIGISIVIFSFFISATRTWIISLLVLVLYFVFKYFQQNKKRLLSKYLLLFFILVFLLIQSATMMKNFNSSYQRALTSTYILENREDEDASMVKRMDRKMEVKRIIAVNPIFGTGFGKEFNQNLVGFTGDSHTGYLNQIANSGIIGLILTLAPIILIMIKLYRTSIMYAGIRIRYSLIILVISFGVLIFVNFLSYQTIGYTLRLNQYFFLALLYNFASLLIIYPENILRKTNLI